MRFFHRAANLNKFWVYFTNGLGVLIINTVTIKKNFEFRRIYKKGRSFVSPLIVVYVLKNKKGFNRIGITTSKKIGKAFMRNRARRIIREAFRSYEVKLQKGYDLVFVARTKTCLAKEQGVEKALGGIFSKSKLFIEQ